jgi:hypothetical protein
MEACSQTNWIGGYLDIEPDVKIVADGKLLLLLGIEAWPFYRVV